MPIQTLVKTSEYHDSVSLMLAARELSEMTGIKDAAVVMATPANKSILADAGLLTTQAEQAGPNDLVIALHADTEDIAQKALEQAEIILSQKKSSEQESGAMPRSIHTAVAAHPQSNIAVISVAGRYAAEEARTALMHDLHVLLFSDNVSIEDEIALKMLAKERGLLLMGPGAGTSILNGVGLGFANQVPQGQIGIVSAAGTGLQEVSSLIARAGLGISQGIGVGGRDLSQDVGGLMTLEAIKALQADPQTRVLVLISKPPHPEVSARIVEQAAMANKPVIICYLGLKTEDKLSGEGFAYADTLQEAAMLAVALAGGENIDPDTALSDETLKLEEQADRLRLKLKTDQRFIRGLYSGGTLCYESQLILRDILDQPVYSNAPLPGSPKMVDSQKSHEHSLVDLGEEEFTVGRPHPMIDFDLRQRRILQEAADPQTAVILLDIVLGYGSHPDPVGELLPAIAEARTLAGKQGRELLFIASLTGTTDDPQGLEKSRIRLLENDIIIMDSNASAARLSALVCREGGAL